MIARLQHDLHRQLHSVISHLRLERADLRLAIVYHLRNHSPRNRKALLVHAFPRLYSTYPFHFAFSIFILGITIPRKLIWLIRVFLYKLNFHLFLVTSKTEKEITALFDKKWAIPRRLSLSERELRCASLAKQSSRYERFADGVWMALHWPWTGRKPVDGQASLRKKAVREVKTLVRVKC